MDVSTSRSDSKIVKRRRYDPVIIEKTCGLPFYGLVQTVLVALAMLWCINHVSFANLPGFSRLTRAH